MAGKRSVSQHTRADGQKQTANRVGGKFDDKRADGSAAAASAFADRTIGGHTVTPGVWDDRAKALYSGPQKMALAVALSRRYGAEGRVSPTFTSDDELAPVDRIFAETSDGYVVDADGWHNRIDALGIEYPYAEARDFGQGSDGEDTIPFDDRYGQDVELAETFAPHFDAGRPPEDPEPWFGNYERDRRYRDGFDASRDGNAGTVYDPRIEEGDQR